MLFPKEKAVKRSRGEGERGVVVRYLNVPGFLEHAPETAALRPYFEHWANDDRMKEAWERALAWGEAHPDAMENAFRRLEKRKKE